MSDDNGSLSPSDVGLTQSEFTFLAQGLAEWGGPAYCTNEMSIAMGYGGARQMVDECQVLRERLLSGESLSAVDWTRILLAVELAFASDVMGSGYEWSTTTGLVDEKSLWLLRSVQRKLVATVAPVVGNGIGTRPPKFD